MSELPAGWVHSRLGLLIELNPKSIGDENAIAGFVPMTMLGTDFHSAVRYETRIWSEIKKGYTHFCDGDVLLAKITPCFENGKAGLVEGMPNAIGAGSTEYFVCRPITQLLSPRYLLAFFKTANFLSVGATQMTGSVGHKRVPKDYLLDAEIPLPPLPEQTRIANKLDTLLARVDSARDRLDRVPGMLKRFRQAVLTAATSGVLTEAWRGDGVSNWIETDVQAIAAVGTGSTPLRSNPAFFSSNGTPWVTSAATSQALVQSADEFVTAAAISAHRLKVFPIGTLLVAMYGEGKTRGQVSQLGIMATINQACAAITVDQSKALSGFIKLVLQANYFEMRAMAEGGNQPNLNLSKIKEFPIQLPTLPEQTEIVRQVEILFAYADRLEARLKSARKLSESLSPAILAKAFRGELVAQDPNDEPAAELLRRIRAGRK